MMISAPPETVVLAEALSIEFGDRVRQDEPLSGHTTLRMGGPADLWLAVQSADELDRAISLAQAHHIPHFVLGGGANLLISDRGIRGLVIENRARQVDFERELVHAESGAILPRLAKQCAQQGLNGLAWAVGVPGTLGGAIVNNAGAYGSDMAASLTAAELRLPDGRRVWMPVTWFEYGYRHSKLKGLPAAEKPIVLQAKLHLTPRSPGEIEAEMAANNQRRKQTQPPGATIGSMFKNPPNDYAGRLIEAAGLKGHRLGNAQISDIHANFFVNHGNATANEVIRLVKLAQSTVAAQFGVTLALEIEIIE